MTINYYIALKFANGNTGFYHSDYKGLAKVTSLYSAKGYKRKKDALNAVERIKKDKRLVGYDIIVK